MKTFGVLEEKLAPLLTSEPDGGKFIENNIEKRIIQIISYFESWAELPHCTAQRWTPGMTAMNLLVP
jgi:hypothetical protein